MDGEQGWITILCCCLTTLFSVSIGGLAIYFMRFGGAIIGGTAGFMFAILLNNGWLYIYGSIILTYSVAGVFFTLCFTFACFEHKFNTSVIFGNSFIGAYMLLRGVSIYVGYWQNEITLLGMMKRGNDIEKIDPKFYAWFGSVIALFLVMVPV